MDRQFDPYQKIERSITKKYRKNIWNPFVEGIKRYQLIQPGDRIAVCISGGKDSMLLAFLMKQLHRYSEIPFSLKFLSMDPGYAPQNRKKIQENAALLQIPLTIFETNIFRVVNKTENNPCYLCARMRRGHLYNMAKEIGCNKIALGHHFSDVIETTLLGLLYGGQMQAMMPKLKSQNFAGMELIRPMYCVHEDAVISWRDYNGLSFLQCACRFTEQMWESGDGVGESKRQEIKQLIRELKKTNPNVEKSIFNSFHAANVDTMIGYKLKGVRHSFLEQYEASEEENL